MCTTRPGSTLPLSPIMWRGGERWTVSSWPTGSTFEALGVECELAVPAALDGAITAEVAETLGAKVIVEAANGPTLPEADPVLERRGVVVVPDILANAGGVTASYFEWAQSRQGFAWEGPILAERLRRIMETAFQDCWQRSKDLKVTLRRAAVASRCSGSVRRSATAASSPERHGRRSSASGRLGAPSTRSAGATRGVGRRATSRVW